MKITNKNNIPAALYKAICNDEYDRGDSDITVTTLIKPAQIQVLEKLHYKDIEIDALDNLCMFLGKMLHKGLEEAEDGAIVEQRFYKDFDLQELGKIRLGGCVDHYDPFTATITDYKLTNVFAVKDGLKQEWKEQLNCYAYLVQANGLPVNKLRLCAIIKDWSKSQAMSRDDYPPTPVIVVDVPMWDMKKTEAYIICKLEDYVAACRNGMFGCCSTEDMWQQPECYKVFKGDNARATKCFSSWEEAKFWIDGGKDSDKYRIVCFQGKRIRCENFCRVSAWCPQYRKYLEEHTDIQ